MSAANPFKGMKMTPRRQEYLKEYQRIRRYQRKLEKEGYVIKYLLKKPPTRITKKTIEDIRSINWRKILHEARKASKSVGVEPERERKAREAKEARTAKKRARRKASTPSQSYKPDFVDIVTENLLDSGRKIDSYNGGDFPTLNEVIEEFNNADTEINMHKNWGEWFKIKVKDEVNSVYKMLRDIMNKYGVEDVAHECEKNSSEIKNIVERLIYDSGGKLGRNVDIDVQRFIELVTPEGFKDEALANYYESLEKMDVDDFSNTIDIY